MILLIDNFDSFVHNLARYFRQLGCETVVERNDQLHRNKIQQMNPAAIVISPGPCTPSEAGYSVDAVRDFSPSIPILGVCLGHQAIVQAFGGEVVKSNQPMHGRSSEITQEGGSIFTGLPPRFTVGRYHSLVAARKSLPNCLQVTAWLDDGTVMAIQHHSLPVTGVQFHPESILTQHGYQMLGNFCRQAGMHIDDTTLENASMLT